MCFIYFSRLPRHIFHRNVNYKDHALKDYQQIISFERLATCWFCHEKILMPCINQTPFSTMNVVNKLDATKYRYALTPFSTMNVVNKLDATKYRYALLEILQLVSSYFLILNKSPSS